jgi:pimeloyl-ACP methyl ester carboxylesterase
VTAHWKLAALAGPFVAFRWWRHHDGQMREMEMGRGGRVLRVRDAGDPDGAVVVYFHGTSSSRLDLCFGEQLAAEHGIRLVSFDRPGYGGSTPAPFGLASIGADAHAIADELGVARFAALGLSGGGPGALAAATVAGDRVTRVGIASGAGPFQLVPGALDELDDDDLVAPTHKVWLSENLPRARLVVYDGEGHLGVFEHLGEMLDALTEPDTEDPASAGLP